MAASLTIPKRLTYRIPGRSHRAEVLVLHRRINGARMDVPHQKIEAIRRMAVNGGSVNAIAWTLGLRCEQVEPHMPEDDLAPLRDWLTLAEHGSIKVYHVGDLAADRAYSRKVAAYADFASAQQRAGRVHLFQRRGKHGLEYLMMKCRERLSANTRELRKRNGHS